MISSSSCQILVSDATFSTPSFPFSCMPTTWHFYHHRFEAYKDYWRHVNNTVRTGTYASTQKSRETCVSDGARVIFANYDLMAAKSSGPTNGHTSELICSQARDSTTASPRKFGNFTERQTIFFGSKANQMIC